MKHTLSLKELLQTDMIPPDDWMIHEWEMLNDLGFEHNGSFKMVLEHEEEFLGKEKKMKMEVYRKREGWYLEVEVNEKKFPVEKYHSHVLLMNRIHDIFYKF